MTRPRRFAGVMSFLPGEFVLTLLSSASNRITQKVRLSPHDLLAIRSALLLERPQDMLREAVQLHEAARRKKRRNGDGELAYIQSRATVCFLASSPEVLKLPSMRDDAIFGHNVFRVGSGVHATDVARRAFLRSVDPNVHQPPRFPHERRRPFAQSFVEYYMDTHGGVVNRVRMYPASRKRETDLQCLFSRSSERLDMNTAWQVVCASVRMLLWTALTRSETPRRVLLLLLQADFRLLRQGDKHVPSEDPTIRRGAADVVRRALIEARHALVTETLPRNVAGLLHLTALLSRLTVSRTVTGEAVNVFANAQQGVLQELDRRGRAFRMILEKDKMEI